MSNIGYTDHAKIVVLIAQRVEEKYPQLITDKLRLSCTQLKFTLAGFHISYAVRPVKFTSTYMTRLTVPGSSRPGKGVSSGSGTRRCFWNSRHLGHFQLLSCTSD